MLAYVTLEEAEAAMGRGLSFGERLWFKYSANKSDFLLHCHNIVFLCFFYSLASLPYVIVELSNNKRIINKFKVQPKVSHTFWEMFRCYKTVMHTFILAVGPLQIISFPIVKLLGIRTDLSLPSGWELFLQLSVYFIIEDFTNYWLHRILHSPWAYQKIHKVHHEYKSPIGLAAPYAHWAEILILGFPSFLGPTLIPVILPRIGCGLFCDNWKPLRLTAVMNSHGVPQNTYHFMEELLTMTIITWLVRIVTATLPLYSPTVILFITPTSYEFPWSPTKYIPFYGGAAYHDYHHLVGENCHCNFASVFTYCDLIYNTHKGYQYKTKLLKEACMNKQKYKKQ